MIATFSRNQARFTNIETDFNNDGAIDEIRTPEGELLLDGFAVKSSVEDIVSSGRSQSSATRVTDRSPAPTVLGVSTSSTSAMSSAEFIQLQEIIFAIQSLVQDHQLTQKQLDVLTDVLAESLQILVSK
jgi:hypothetical protein